MSGWQIVQDFLQKARNPCEVLPAERAQGERALVALQVTTKSPMGAIAYNCGGILLDHGWVRILGGGHERLRGIAEWNRLESARRIEDALLVADDAVGGFFAINAGTFEGKPGNLFYLRPDTLRWEDIDLGYTNFLEWLTMADLERYYEGLRWPQWKEDVAALKGEEAFSIYPVLWAKGPPIAERSRRPVPVGEVWGLNAVEFPRQLGLPMPDPPPIV